MGKTAQAIMEKAVSFLGVKENPAQSNNVEFNTDYYGHAVSGDYPWCCVFVWDVFRLCGASDLFYNGEKTAYCPAVQAWAKNEKLAVDRAAGAYGDLVLFDWNGNGSADHIGFIEKKNSDGSYATVEGNTSDGTASNGGEVQRHTRYLSQICCVIHPKYEAAEETCADRVCKALGLEQQTKDYLNKYKYADALWKRIESAIAAYETKTGESEYAPRVSRLLGLEDITRSYLDDYRYADALWKRLYEATVQQPEA